MAADHLRIGLQQPQTIAMPVAGRLVLAEVREGSLELNVAREELIGGLDRGLLVTRFHYTNVVHPKLAMITGMTRDGTFLVEGGKIVGPVRNLRFTQSYLDALAGVSAVSSSRKTIKGFLGAAVVPALRIDGWTFTGVTEH